MNIRDISRMVDRQLMNVSAHCTSCNSRFHPGWGSCDCEDQEMIRCVRCKRESVESDESFVDVLNRKQLVEIVCDHCIDDKDVEV